MWGFSAAFDPWAHVKEMQQVRYFTGFWGVGVEELLFTATHGTHGLNKFSSGLGSSFADFLVG